MLYGKTPFLFRGMALFMNMDKKLGDLFEKGLRAHYAMDAYMKEKGLMQSVVVEEYITDPMTEKDPAKWLTKIYYVVK